MATAPSNPKSHRVILPTGSLFFLNVRQSKKEQVITKLSRVYFLQAARMWRFSNFVHVCVEWKVCNFASVKSWKIRLRFEKIKCQHWHAANYVVVCGLARWCSETRTKSQFRTLHSTFKYSDICNKSDFQDTGVYWCEAENAGGKVRSRNATLEVAGEFTINVMDLFAFAALPINILEILRISYLVSTC